MNYEKGAAMTGAFVELSGRALRDGCREPSRSTRLGPVGFHPRASAFRPARSACQLHLTLMLENFGLEVSVWPPAESAFTTELLFNELDRRIQLVLYLFEDCA
ncbi:hypothetical protein KHW15_14265 [Pseudomonas syringae]|uniref:hypothetical protein n=1 Tax=Pseudomonas syringae TaxID=317 RepID=UPI0013045706|nr:hypothetical protein [Pseudomonas syringae]MBI6783660.1 hypothetical protein [Pseudomonas syringae]MBS7415550.1 hypothetical protein [Pseudomonas syringae]MBS7431704.1 hypothetical protein [Pseudomonas syringae]QVI78200.1 hypothetical protein KHW15_14265 [Pseudomonas syringae]